MNEENNNIFNEQQPVNPQQQTINNMSNSVPPVQPPLPPLPPKKSKGPLVIIILLLLAVLGMAGYICYDKFITKDTPKETKNTTEKEETKKEVLLKDKTKDVVYTYLDKKITNVNGEYTYKIPQFNIDSKDAETLNQSIIDDLKKEYDEAEKDSILAHNNINYKYYTNGEIVSILAYNAFDTGDFTSYSTYNINQYTGKKVTNKDLLDLKKIKTSEFASKLVETFKKVDPIENWKSMESGQSDFDREQYQKNVNNLTNGSYEDYNMYLNEKNELNVIFKRHGIAGENILNLF